MKKQEWNPHVYPPDGWMFEVDGIKLYEQEYEELVGAVERYYTKTGRDVTHAETDVVSQLCNRFPPGCRNPENVVQATVKPDVLEHAQRHAYAVYQQHKSGNFQTVDPELVRKRAEICRNCPLHGKFSASCLGCVDNLNDFVDTVGSKYPGYVTGMKACGRYKAHTGLLTISSLPKDSSAPQNCWRNPENPY